MLKFIVKMQKKLNMQLITENPAKYSFIYWRTVLWTVEPSLQQTNEMVKNNSIFELYTIRSKGFIQNVKI